MQLLIYSADVLLHIVALQRTAGEDSAECSAKVHGNGLEVGEVGNGGSTSSAGIHARVRTLGCTERAWMIKTLRAGDDDIHVYIHIATAAHVSRSTEC